MKVTIKELSNETFWYHVGNMVRLYSSYAQRWYTLFYSSLNHQVYGLMVEDIRSMMLIPDAYYTQKSDLLKRVVYDPIGEINLETEVKVEFTYYQNKRRPVLGFNFFCKFPENSKEIVFLRSGGMLLESIKKEYNIDSELFQIACRSPLIVAAIIQADDKIKTGKTFIEISKYLYMRKVVMNSMNYLKPIQR